MNSILTLDPPPNKDKPEEGEDYLKGPRSIIQLAVDNKIDPLFLVENNLSGFVKAYKNSKENKLKLRFGLKLVMTNDMSTKTPDSLNSEHKVIVFCRNDAGYKRLLKIYSEAATKGFYYRPRLDSATLEKFWDKRDLLLAHSFYYSFLHRNLLYFSNCQPNYNFANNVFFIEKNDLPFNYLIEGAVDKFCNGTGLKQNVQSIYYEKNADFKTFAAYKCIKNRTTLEKPNEDHFSSSLFSLENFLKNEKTNK
jgi:DNA polymerase III alpha subunit